MTAIVNGPGQNCFLQRHALRFSAFNEVLPGLIRLSDVDGICEINKRILLLEAKSSGVKVTHWTEAAI